MKQSGKNKVCSVEKAGMLDIGLRKLFHCPHKILKPYIEEGMTVIDLGCGPGYFTIEMAKMAGNSGKVIAVDLQGGMLDIVKSKVEKLDLGQVVELHQCEADKIGLDQKADFILIFFMLHEVPDQPFFLKEVFELLKSRGKVLIVEPRFHVKANDFERSVRIMNKIGFQVINEPNILLSRSVLLRKQSE